jgi:predicted PurR-regulated permease PerM
MTQSAGLKEQNSLGWIAKAGFVWIGLVVVVLLLWKISTVVLLIFCGCLAAIFLRSLADFVTARVSVSNGLALSLVLATLVLIAGLMIYFVGQPLVDQMTELAEKAPRALRTLRDQGAETRWGKWLLNEAPQSMDDLPVPKDSLAQHASNAAGTTMSGLAGLLVIIFISLYLAFDAERYVAGTVRLVPPRRRERLREVLTEVGTALRWWLLGKIISMILVGAATTLGLWLLEVPLAFALGILAALLTFIPNFGPIVSAIPALLLALVESPLVAAYVIVLYVGIQFVESYLITPLIQQRAVSLPPVMTISAQIAMGILFGGLGVIAATPLTAALLVFVKRLYVEDVLEKGLAPEMVTSGTVSI